MSLPTLSTVSLNLDFYKHYDRKSSNKKFYKRGATRRERLAASHIIVEQLNDSEMSKDIELLEPVLDEAGDCTCRACREYEGAMFEELHYELEEFEF